MTSLVVRDMEKDDEYFVGTCTHTNESSILDQYAEKRISWLRNGYSKGVRVKVALVDGIRRGFIYLMPSDVCPVEPLGESSLMSIPCLFVSFQPAGSGIGRELIIAAEKEAHIQNKQALVTIGNYTDFWFMPGSFFEKCGFTVAERQDKRAILLKSDGECTKPPCFFTPCTDFPIVPDKVVLDLFWMTFCGALDKDIVRKVVAEFGDVVILREHCADDRATLLKYQINRGLFVNGNRVAWDFENPENAIRSAVSSAINMNT